MSRVAIMVAPNGARKDKLVHSRLPMTIEEIVADVRACRDAGAILAHVHARDANGKHTLGVEYNRKLYQALETAIGDSMLLQLTTESIGIYTPEQQIRLIYEVKPQAVSIALRELFGSDEHQKFVQQFCFWMVQQRMVVQWILYSADELARYCQLVDARVLPQQGHHLLLVLGQYNASQPAEPHALTAYYPLLKEVHVPWGVCAFGQREAQCLVSAALLGGDVRVGFENNHQLASGDDACCNAEQVRQIRDQLSALDVDLHTAHSFYDRVFTASCAD